jgi:drug/metabolite transporter (DMT)-like permease
VTVPPWTERALAVLRFDRNPPHRRPSSTRTAVATMASLAGSLAADALLVAVGTRLFPSSRGYVHFRFSDYGLLTVVGVLAACLAWPVTVRLTSAPRLTFLRLAVLVTLVLWLPDLWILAEGQPPEAVAVLMVMHVSVAVVTYNLLVRLAPVRSARVVSEPTGDTSGATGGSRSEASLARRAGVAMGSLVGAELVLGIGTLVIVPYDRPDVWIPARDHLLYLTHAALGGILGLGSVVLLLATRRASRIAHLGAIVGFVGVILAAAGGVASVDRPTRLLGVGLMLVGAVVAAFGYLMLIIPVTPRDDPGEPPDHDVDRVPPGP